MMHLITGYAGYEHIQSEDDGAFNAAFFGNGQYVMETGNQFDASILDNNTVRILDGDGLMYGRHFRLKPGTYEDLTITTGTAGKNRIDLICVTYEKNENDGTEQVYSQVIKGTEVAGTASIPEYTDGNILEGASLNHMPLYKVIIEGVVLKDIEPLFVTIPTYKALAEKYAAQFEATINALKTANILDSMEEIEANTQEKMIAGALAVKEGLADVNSNLESKSDCITDCNTIAELTSACELNKPFVFHANSSLMNELAGITYAGVGYGCKVAEGVIDGTIEYNGGTQFASFRIVNNAVSKWEEYAKNSDLELKTITLTKVTNDYAEVFDSNTYCYVKNGVCYLQLAVTIKGVYSGWAKVGSIPYRPVDKDVLFPISSPSRTKGANFRIDTAGNIYAFPNDNATHIDIGSVVFPCV